MASLVLAGSLSPLDVVERYLERIKKLNPTINAFINVAEEHAKRTAEELEKALKKGFRGKLAGVPIAIKDIISTKGIETTCASKILKGYVPPYDATVIKRLKAEGAIIIGKTNMDEFAMGSSTELSAYGPTRNPWNLERVAGGSSGGSAAAVAARMAPASLGSDTGGSIRCPAAFCNIVGLKPTYGTVSRYGLISYACSLEQIGPMTIDVEDCALLMDIISGRDGFDSTLIDYKFKWDPGSVKGLKIAVPREFFGEGTDERVADLVWKVIKLLESNGAVYEEVSMPLARYALACYYIIAMSEASSNLARYDGVRYGLPCNLSLPWHEAFSEVRSKGFGMEVERRIILGCFALSAGYYGRYYLKALKIRTMIRDNVLSLFRKFDVIATPTTPFPPFKIGEKIGDPLSLYMADVDTVVANLTGVPAISVPAGFVDGLPVGAQFMANYCREDILLTIAKCVQDETKFNVYLPREAAI
ncbi:MAG: Asp-tRNA(Asn)/Glu-tRNA(Gln) amidotransferase subunit GatA [Nitrososphaerota archaeon]|nr:Asp-tRNA(Asn)/Glu-tRNA(Gln) amidotransferase subunit GatA [Nitrososphaerota archaeon]